MKNGKIFTVVTACSILIPRLKQRKARTQVALRDTCVNWLHQKAQEILTKKLIHPHQAVDKHHAPLLKSLLYEVGHHGEVSANIGLWGVWQLQPQELNA